MGTHGGRKEPLTSILTIVALVAIAAQPGLAFADDLTSGARVKAPAAFFMCGARDDLEAMKVLHRQRDGEAAVKLATDRCERGAPGYHLVVIESEGDKVCIRRDGRLHCMWALRSAVQAVP
jgi:hypothetical protein